MRDQRKTHEAGRVEYGALAGVEYRIICRYSTVMVRQGLALLALIPLAFHNTHGRDDGIYRLATHAKNCVSGS